MRRLLVLLAVLGGLLAIGGPATADDARVVRVGTEGVYPPFSYRDQDTNQLTGFDIDVIKAVADEAGWDLQFVEAPFDSLFPALDSKRIDVIANQVTITGERKARYLFSTPYTYSHGVIVTAASVPEATYKAATIDRQCRLMYDVATSGRPYTVLPDSFLGPMKRSLVERGPAYYWGGAVRQLLRRQPEVLES